MPDNRLTEEIRKMFSEKMLVEVKANEEDLIHSGTLDSLRLAELLVHLEEQFAYRVSMEDLDIEDLRSIASIAAMLERQGVRIEVRQPAAPRTILIPQGASDITVAS
jgi:acyl carrier protein